MTWHGTVHDMVTLAHEAGHAWHSCVLRPARSFAASYPMTLAETASNFAEDIVLGARLGSDALRSWRRGHGRRLSRTVPHRSRHRLTR